MQNKHSNNSLFKSSESNLSLWLHRLLILASLIGIFLSLLKLDALWSGIYLFMEREKYGLDSMQSFVDEWANWKVIPIFRQKYYARYVVFNGLCIVFLLIFHKRVRNYLDFLLAWGKKKNHVYARRVILFVVLVIIFTYQMKIYWGFWFSGITGWDFSNRRVKLITYDESLKEDLVDVTNKVPDFLRQAINFEAIQYLPKKGFLEGNAIFLHYRTGEVLPANYELTEIVFPQYVFGPMHREIRDPSAFFQIIQQSLNNRSKNRRFLLPLQISYPNHAPYLTIDYSSYPQAEDLMEISIWSMVVELDPAAPKNVEILNAKKLINLKRNEGW